MTNHRSVLEHLEELDELEALIDTARSRRRRARRHWFVETPLVALVLWISNDVRVVVAGVAVMAAVAFALYVAGSMDLDAWRFRRDCLVDSPISHHPRRGRP